MKKKKKILILGDKVNYTSDWMDDEYFTYMDFMECHQVTSFRIKLNGVDTLIPNKIMSDCVVSIIFEE